MFNHISLDKAPAADKTINENVEGMIWMMFDDIHPENMCQHAPAGAIKSNRNLKRTSVHNYAYFHPELGACGRYKHRQVNESVN